MQGKTSKPVITEPRSFLIYPRVLCLSDLWGGGRSAISHREFHTGDLRPLVVIGDDICLSLFTPWKGEITGEEKMFNRVFFFLPCNLLHRSQRGLDSSTGEDFHGDQRAGSVGQRR